MSTEKRSEFGPLLQKLRSKLKLSQKVFSETYNIPLGSLRNWEQDRSNPDHVAQAYLILIATEPELVKKIIAKAKKSSKR